jgi:hypothetical protein
MVARCGACHSSPPTGTAPATFRLDKYSASDGTDGVQGAFEQAARIRARVVLQLTMPPDAPLPRGERDLVEEWVAAGAPR